ncbi:actin-domain-containing protein [Trametes punicea]|nr:actin-domain-containing protein [Trametes punicea]
MSTVPATPRRQAHESATPAATPQATRVGTSHIIQSSPHYQTTRRHSLYGTEDRIILDPGSRIWKVGFSGEGKPRDVFLAERESGISLWSLNRASKPEEREEEDRILEAKLQACLRSVFHDSLLTDPKSRKVILVEHPLLPLHIKEMMARVLFNNLQVPSISFASSHLLALLAAGRVTGLVLDCGHLETTVLPVFSFRPLYPHLRTTPLAGARLSSHIKALLLMFGTYIPPATSLSAAVNIPAASRSVRVPEDVLADKVIDEIKTRCCFVGEPIEDDSGGGGRASSPGGDGGSDLDLPRATPRSADAESVSFSSSAHAASSAYSVVSHSQLLGNSDADTARLGGERRVQALAMMYGRHSTATDIHMRVDPPPSQQTGTGRGTLIIPGWIRERAAEVLFEGGDVDESSVAEVILDCLLKVPVDLRKTLASSILVVGGTPMLPGFIPRLQAELVRTVTRTSSRSSPPSPPPPSTRSGRSRRAPPPLTGYNRYATLRPLLPFFAILNNPAPPLPASANAAANAGKAPAFTPATMAWVGGSLAGALKTGGVEVQRERWDEADAGAGAAAQSDDGDVLMDDSPPRPRAVAPSTPRSILPDWTRTPLPVGAPPAPRPAPAATASGPASPHPALHAQSVAG